MTSSPLIWRLFTLALFLSSLAPMPAAVAAPTGTSYYVSPNGDDANAGTLATPFRTVQKCAEVAQAGDTCYLRAGTYRETVTVPRSGAAGQPIVFASYPGELATLSGADVITATWAISTGAVYSTAMNWSVKNIDGNPLAGAMAVDNQIWANGVMLTEARWPNIPLTKTTYFTRSDLAIADGGYSTTVNSGVYTDSDLSGFGTNHWVGGKMNVAPGQMWVNITCNITASTSSTLGVVCPGQNFNEGAYVPRSLNHYFLWGKLAALDAPGEWFRAGTANTGTLYVWLPNNADPNTQVMEAKRRLWAFDLRGQGHIQLTNLRIWAASVRMDGTTHDVVLSELDMRYLWHFQEYPAAQQGMSYKGALRLAGTNIELRDSVLSEVAAGVIYVGGENNRMVNNVLYNLAYMGVNLAISGEHSPTITTTHFFSQNTIFNTGAQAVYMVPLMDILYNDAYHSHALITDMGIIYEWGTNGRGAEIAYNYAHDNLAIRGGPFPSFFGGSAIYFDFASSDYVAHHNVTWNTNKAGILAFAWDHDPVAVNANPGITDMNLLIYNNTVVGDLFVDTAPTYHMTGTEVINNLVSALASGIPPNWTGVYTHTYVFGNADPGFFSDYAAHDYRLTGGPAVDYGMLLPPYTTVYSGTAPDAGAFEGLTQDWVAGALLRLRDLAGLQVVCTGTGTATCTVSNLPIGRKVPVTFRIRLGNAAAGGVCRNQTNYATHYTTATCTGVPVSGNADGQPVGVSLDGETWVWLNDGYVVYGPWVRK